MAGLELALSSIFVVVPRLSKRIWFFQNGDFRMLIILPFPDATLASVDEKLKTKDLSEVLKELYSTEVDVSLPRFKIESELDLEGALKEVASKKLPKKPIII